ncbi:MAG: 23S rRNA (guanosine(2251)-2'-O)-methyltransferase RlmB, partial [Bradyrhizobium sp.]
MSDRDRKPPFPRQGGKSSGKFAGKPRKFERPQPWRDREQGSDGPVILYGWHTVTLALGNPKRRIRKLYLTENAARRLADERIETKVTPE